MLGWSGSFILSRDSLQPRAPAPSVPVRSAPQLVRGPTPDGPSVLCLRKTCADDRGTRNDGGRATAAAR
jgi:hypothetical protein